MRESLFRGKRLDNGEWVEGNYCKAELLDKSGYEHFIIEVQAEGAQYKVDPATVGQYTGLTDKHGKRIFEGDVVKTKEYGKNNGSGQNFLDYDLFQIAFAEGGFCVENIRRRFNLCRGNILEVIGNIHDNPELLEEQHA